MDGVHVEVIETPELGDRSYIAHDGQVAVVIDPQRDIDRVLAITDRLGLTVELVLETHVHNDYVTGGLVLAQETGATYALAAAEPVDFDRLGLKDRDQLHAGSLQVTTFATPGHTEHHLAFAIEDRIGDVTGVAGPSTASTASSTGLALFTGGSLLYGSVGRTDLLGNHLTDRLTGAQYRSARLLAAEMPDAATVLPTHGFGSFCSAGSTTGAASSTIGDEKQRNDALTEPDEDAFVARLVKGLTAYPAYYAHMAPLNRRGPGPIDLSPLHHVDAVGLAQRIADGEWVVDLRDRKAYAAGHLPGTAGIELGSQFATYLGWVLPWGVPLTLVGESAEQIRAAQRQLGRIGIDHLAGAHIVPADSPGEDPAEIRETLRTASFGELFAVQDRVAVLDVRADDEHAAAHLPGSLHIPLGELLGRRSELPDRPIWVHCQSGYRAAIAASLLQRAGHDVVWVNDDLRADDLRTT